DVVTTTLRVPLFAVTVAPTGMKSPSSGDLFAGLPTKSRFCFTTDAVSFVPSVHVMPERSVNSTFFGETTFQACATPDTILPGPARLTRVSYAYVSTYLVVCRTVICGSRLPGSPGMATVADPEGPAACFAVADGVTDSRRATPATTRLKRLRMPSLLLSQDSCRTC